MASSLILFTQNFGKIQSLVEYLECLDRYMSHRQKQDSHLLSPMPLFAKCMGGGAQKITTLHTWFSRTRIKSYYRKIKCYRYVYLYIRAIITVEFTMN